MKCNVTIRLCQPPLIQPRHRGFKRYIAILEPGLIPQIIRDHDGVTHIELCVCVHDDVNVIPSVESIRFVYGGKKALSSRINIKAWAKAAELKDK